jgi:hypothetical protein
MLLEVNIRDSIVFKSSLFKSKNNFFLLVIVGPLFFKTNKSEFKK